MADLAVNILEVDKSAYATEQTSFLADKNLFKTGSVGAGLFALAHLKSMYNLLWFRRHTQKNKEESVRFVELIKTVENEIIQYAKTHKQEQPQETVFKNGFRDLISRFELIEERYQQIIMVCEAK